MGMDGQKVFLDGEDVSEAIREPDVAVWASQVSQHPGVRQGLLALQRKMGEGPLGAVLEGRDIGTVVFPQAQVKVFLTADPMERAKRRVTQMAEQEIFVSLEAVHEGIVERDKRDQERAIAPLVRADDAVEIDSTKVSMEEVVQTIIKLVTEARGQSS
jgi:cytidylate kinase